MAFVVVIRNKIHYEKFNQCLSYICGHVIYPEYSSVYSLKTLVLVELNIYQLAEIGSPYFF